MPLQMSKWLHSLHEGHEGGLAYYGQSPSWIVFTEAIGSNPNDLSTKDFSQWSNAGFWPICRINNGYEPAGTIPASNEYGNFAARVGAYVSGSKGCMYWIIGNEPNAKWEWPNGQPISPEAYVACFKQCRTIIKNLSGHRGDVVIPAPTAVWNVDSGDWLDYQERVWKLLESDGCDGLSIHAYSHGSDPSLITSEQKMDAPYQDRYYNFRAYRDYLVRVPKSMRSLPVLITESDQNDPWLNQSNGWIPSAYTEIEAWNDVPEHQTIQCLAMYRFPTHDQWYMTGKQAVLNDFVAAVNAQYLAAQPRLFITSIPTGPSLGKGTVTATLLNVRSTPEVTSTNMNGSRKAGDVVNIYELANDSSGQTWARIGLNQWVLKQWLTTPISNPATSFKPADDFARNLQFVLKWEGDWADDPHDAGGATMKGVTYLTFVNYLRSKGRIQKNILGQEILPTKEDLKNISDADLYEIYRGIWHSSGADKLSYPMNLAVFDAAVNAGDKKAQEFLASCGQNFWCYMTARGNWYKSLSDAKYFGEAWENRCRDLVATAYANR